MSQEILFTVYDPPRPKGRARSVKRPGGKIGHYTPKDTVNAQKMIRETFLDLGEPLFSRETALGIAISIFLPKPKSAPKRRKYPTTRPDWDNYAKLVCDALEGYAYENDGQLVAVTVHKHYGNPPRLSILIFPIEEVGVDGKD